MGMTTHMKEVVMSKFNDIALVPAALAFTLVLQTALAIYFVG
jgi:hypothetical protein